MFESRSWRGVLDTALGDTVCHWIATVYLFSPNTPVSPTNKSDRHDIAEILLKVALNTITITPNSTPLFPIYSQINYLYLPVCTIFMLIYPSLTIHVDVSHCSFQSTINPSVPSLRPYMSLFTIYPI